MRPSFNLVLIKKGNRSDIYLIKQDLDRPRLDHKNCIRTKFRSITQDFDQIVPNLDQSRDQLLNFTKIIVQNSGDATIES